MENVSRKTHSLFQKENLIPILITHLVFSISLTYLIIGKKIKTKDLSLLLLIFSFLFVFISFSFVINSFRVWEYFGIIVYLFLIAIFIAVYTLEKMKEKRGGKILLVNSPEEDLPKVFLILISLLVLILYFYKLGGFGIQMDGFYHANVVKEYFKTEELFANYTRSKLTSLLGVWSTQLFSFLKINANQEFILRFPFALLGVINVLLVYLLTKEYAKNKKIAAVTALLFTIDPWIIQFARYFRFYTPSITVILFCLYLIKKENFSIKILLLTFFISAMAYLYLQEFLLVLLCFIGLLLIIRLIEEKKVVFALPPAIFLVLLIGKRLLSAVNSNATYDLVSWSFDFEKMKTMFLWLLYNYGFYLFLSLGAIISALIAFWQKKDLKLSKKYYLEVFLLINLVFLFFYVVHVPFNFTFRPILFFLPLLYILAVNIFYKIFPLNKNAELFLLFVFLVTLAFSIKYHVNEEGDKYFPTRLVYEKIEIATGNKDMANFLKGYLTQNKIEKYFVHYVGLSGGHLNYYLNIDLKKNGLVTYRHSAKAKSTLAELKKNIEENPNHTHFIVINANAQTGRVNYVYKIFWDKDFVTEVSPSFAIYVKNNGNFKEIYLSKDGASKIYKLN
ncbi:MAG: hypothetical protein PHN37_03095 [Candidatus Pacebacteria bacterium]|nr:hypothetical protein [Candidatus Paceibacterota bacterium]